MVLKSLVSESMARIMRNSAFLIFAIVCVVAVPPALFAEEEEPGTCKAKYKACESCPSCESLCNSECEDHHWNELPAFCNEGSPGACDPSCPPLTGICYSRTCTCLPNDPQ
jgi:hypothetical protein